MTPVDASSDPPTPPDAFGAALRGFGPVGVLAILVILAIGNTPVPGTAGALVLLWMQRTRTPWRQIGYVRPRHPWVTVAVGIVAGVAFKLVMKSLVMPLLGADPVNHAYHQLAGNAAALPGAILLMLVGGGFGEETVHRGFMFERLGRLFGSNAIARVAVVVAGAVVFAAPHALDQGRAGVEQALMTGLTFGIVRMRTGRIAGVMVAHAAFDLAAVALIYANLETRVAHWVFR